MAAPAELIAHGSLSTPVLTEERIRTSLHDLDRGSLVYHAADADAFEIGDQPSGYGYMYVQDIARRAMPGFYEFTLDVEGIISGAAKRIGLSWSEDPFGWDIAHEERIESVSYNRPWGSALGGYSTMRFLNQDSEDKLDNVWARRRLQWKGIRRRGLFERKVAVNENITKPADPIKVTLQGGWTDFRNATISFPRVVLTERFKDTIRPRTELIPGPWYGPPPSGIGFPLVQVFNLSGSDITYNWPNGWKIASIDSEELYSGSGIWINTYTFEYVWEKQW